MAVAVLPSTLPVALLARSNTAPASARKPQKTKENKNANERCAACDLYRPLQRQSTPYNHPPVFEKGLGCVECALLCAWTLCVCVWPVSAAGKKRTNERNDSSTSAKDLRSVPSVSLTVAPVGSAQARTHIYTHLGCLESAVVCALDRAVCVPSAFFQARKKRKTKEQGQGDAPHASSTHTHTHQCNETHTHIHTHI